MTSSYIKSKKFNKSDHNYGLIILSTIITFSIIILSFLYLFQTNSLVSCNFKIRDYQKNIKQLEVKAERLEMSIAQWQSPSNLEGLVDSLGMIELEEVTYLSGEEVIAIRE